MASRLPGMARHLRRIPQIAMNRALPAYPTTISVSAPIYRHLATTTPTHPTTRKPKGKVPGFSYPGPRSLDKVVKIQLLQKHGTPRVREIWAEYHKDHKTAVGDSLTVEEHNLLMQRTKRCSIFVLPVPRENGYFTLLLQFQDKYCLCTYLEDYKKDPSAALPYLTFTIFDDMVQKKNVALVRGEVSNHMTVAEAGRIWEHIKTFYLGPRHLFDNVVAFNEKGQDFDFRNVLNVTQVAS